MRAHHLAWLTTAVFALGALGCGSEPAGEPAYEQDQVDGIAAAVRLAIEEVEQRQGITVDEADKQAAAAWVEGQMAAAREDDTGSTTAALEDPDQLFGGDGGVDQVLGGGGGGTTSGSFGTGTGATSGSFGTGTGATSGSFGTSTGGTGGSFSGSTAGAQSGGFGSSTQFDPASVPCRNYGVVTAIGSEDLAGLTFGLDCVTAGSNPILRWPTIAGAPYEVLTVTFDLDTIFRLLQDPGAVSPSFIDRHVWGPVQMGGTSVTYGGPTLSAAGGVGILVGGVESNAGEFGLFIAVVLPF